jgi:hypothetical protein
MSAPVFYVTTFCNRAHHVATGKPLEHECRVLPPAALQAEIAGEYEIAIALLRADKHRARYMRRGMRAPRVTT